MEIRKIQVTGAGDTRIISLPKEWAERHSLDKGANVIIKELSNGDLIIYPQQTSFEPPKRTSTIIESDHVTRDILAAYLLGSDIISVVTSDRQPLTKKSEIKELSRQLIGLEILGETQNSLELHFLIDSNSLPNPREYVRRCFTIANQMQNDSIKAFLTNNSWLAEEVINRDVEVNRLYFLIVRMLKIMVEDKRETSALNSTACLDWRMVATYSEDLGDASVEFAEVLKTFPKMKEALSAEILSKIRILSEMTTNMLNLSLECFLDQNVNEAENIKNLITNKLSNLHKEIQDDISKLEKEVVWRFSSLLNFLKQLRETAIDIGDLVATYNLSHEIQ